MKIHHATVKYYIEDALCEIYKVLKGCENRSLKDEEFKVYMEHALHMINFVYNIRNLSRKEVSKLSQAEYEYKMLPPRDVFPGLFEKQRRKRIASES